MNSISKEPRDLRGINIKIDFYVHNTRKQANKFSRNKFSRNNYETYFLGVFVCLLLLLLVPSLDIAFANLKNLHLLTAKLRRFFQ